MIFQTLDSKQECVGIYANERLIFDKDKFPANLTRTWSPSSYSLGTDAEYASLYLEGKDILNVLPEYLVDDWKDALARLQSFERAFQIAQMDKEEHCFYDIVPTRFLRDYCDIRNRITQYVFDNCERPRRYAFHHQISSMLFEISQRHVKVDTRFLNSFIGKSRYDNYARQMLKKSSTVSYNQFGTRTGRLTSHSKSFPILTLPSALRPGVVCQNDYYVEIDFNGAEIRTLLGLLDKPQPLDDVHTFHMENVFDNRLNRDEAKVAFFAWLYGSKRGVTPTSEERLRKFYDKDALLEKYWKDGCVKTIFGKEIKNVSEHHALNYIVQSTAAELLLKQALKINHLLKQKEAKSNLCFLIHDSIVLDFCKEEERLLDAILYLFSSTNFGKFGVNIKRGKTLGTLK